MAVSMLPQGAELSNLTTVNEVLDWIGFKNLAASTANPVQIGRPARTSLLTLIGDTDVVRHIAAITPPHTGRL